LTSKEEEELLKDRVRFKLHAAAEHLNKLKEIDHKHGNINNLRVQSEMEIDCFLAHIIGAKDALLVEVNNKLNLGMPIQVVELETVNKELKKRNKAGLLKDLNKISSDPNSWFWRLNEIRNHFLHRDRIPRHVSISIFENADKNTTSSNQSIGFVENNRIKNANNIISFFEESLCNMAILVKDLRDKIPAYMYTGPVMTEEKRLFAFLNTHQEEIINWVNNNVKTQLNDTASIFDRTANMVSNEYPYGETIDNAHRFLTTAIMSSLWCGWFSKARANANDVKFSPEYVKKFRNIITEAFDMGVKFADVKP
jgi:hypothetical protein